MSNPNSLIQNKVPENMEEVHVRMQRIERGIETMLAVLQKLGNSNPTVANVVNVEIQKFRRELREAAEG